MSTPNPDTTTPIVPAAPVLQDVALDHDEVSIDDFISARNKGETTVKVAATEKPAADAVADKTTDDASAAGKALAAQKRTLEGRKQTIQQDINALVAERGKTQRERDETAADLARLKAEQAELQAQIDTAKGKTPATPAKPDVSTDGEPKPTWAEFEAAGKSYDDFLDARDEWSFKTAQAVARKTLADERAAADKASADERFTRAQQSRVAKFHERLDAARTKHADFDAIVSTDTPLTQPMQDVIIESEVGPDILLHFAEHPEDAKRIASLHPLVAIREMGKIEARVEARSGAAHSGPAPTSTRTTSAPDPIKPVVSGSTASTVPLADQDTDSYIATRNREEMAQRRRR